MQLGKSPFGWENWNSIHFAFFFFFSFCSRILFKDKDRNWDEIENKLRSESDLPLLKTSNKVQKPVCLSNV